MSRARAGALALVLGLLLTGCAGNAGSELRAAVAELTDAANRQDASGVRNAVDDVLARLPEAQRAGDVSPEGAAAIRERALAVQAAADGIDPEVIARREAEQRAQQEEQERREAERQAAEAEAARVEAERLAQEEAERAAEEQRKQAEEDAKRAEEERKRAEEEAKKAKEEQEDEDDAEVTPSPSTSVAP